MDASIPFRVIAVTALLVYVVASIMIMAYLNRRGIAINFLLSRFLIFRYVDQYRALTREATGRTGPLFYTWIISVNTALVATILAVVL